ncbi:galactose-1-phosphate uridylyltransferase [Kocuria gwangalliensis]|uniref:Galactose-1-phosphate uridylyltransferase n=1 Tax=Kocuria gwangalliensis TaxID=501592 RepID=A0ABP8WLN0_9MICC
MDRSPIGHRTHRLADGREAVFFSDRGAAPVEHVVDARPLGERSGHGQVRFDRLTGEWIAVAAHRQSRTYLPPADECPLCPSVDGRESEIPVEDFHVVAFENRFPSLGPELGELPSPEGAKGRVPGGAPSSVYGRCKVVVFTPEHDGSFASLHFERAGTVVEAWAQRTEALSRHGGHPPRVPVRESRRKNRRDPASTARVDLRVPVRGTDRRTTGRALAAHLDATGRPLMGELLSDESDAGDRMVLTGDHFSAYVSYAARWPLEVHLVPHRQVPDLAALTSDERVELGVSYRDLVRRLDRLYSTPTPYIAAWHQT